MYELLYIVPAIYTEDELKKVSNRIEELLKTDGASVKETQNFGKIRMAYSIKKHTVGYYIMVDFDAPSESIKIINRTLQLEKDALRFMIVKKIVGQKGSRGISPVEFQEVDPSKRVRDRREATRPSFSKEKIKLEDMDKKLDTLLEKEIV